MEYLPISVVIITKNEAANIARAISSVLPVCNDVIVIDSGSKDQTAAIASSLGARVYDQAWQGYSKTKNIGNSFAKHPYVFSLDADEAFSFGLIQSLEEIFKDPQNLKPVYKVNRLNHFAGKAIRHGAWFPDWQYRLFNKELHHWEESFEVHELLNFNTQTPIGTLQGELLHYTTETEAHYVTKMIQYASLFSEKRKLRGKKSAPLKAYSSAIFRFLKEYIAQGGCLDGVAGYKIAKAHFTYTLNKYL